MAKMYRKLAPCGGEGGHEWDDDVYEGIRKVYVGQDFKRITYVKFEYVKDDGEVVTREYGTITLQPKEFPLDPDEHIIMVAGTFHRPDVNEVITSLIFKTSKGKMSPWFGPTYMYKGFAGTEFVFYDEGKKIVGFHGRSGNALDALGVYFVHDSSTTSFPLYKLEAQGGTKGRVWDNGFYDCVKTLRIGLDNCRITYLEFEYVKGKESETCHQGVKGETPSEFLLEDGEYLTVVVGYYDKIFGVEEPVIISLKFKTNKRESTQFGINSGQKFLLGEKDHKIVGFHGQASTVIHSVGVTVVPSTTTE